MKPIQRQQLGGVLFKQSLEELAPLDQHLEKQHQEKTKVKNINVVEMGKFEMDTW